MKSQEKQKKLKFPCLFTFKIIGLANKEFEGEVMKILNRHFPKLGEGAIRTNQSKNGKYLAFSVKVHAISQEQLDGCYQDLSNNELIIFAL